MSTKPKYPKYMPVLRAKDLIRGRYDKGNCRCLSGWINEAVSGKFYPPGKEAVPGHMDAAAKLHRAVAEECALAGLQRSELGCKPPLPSYNDNPDNPLAKLAKAFNRAMRKKGYVWEMDR